MWPLVIIIVAAFIMASTAGPKAKGPKPASLQDVDLPRADEGAEKSVLFGQRWTKDWQVLSVRNLRTRKIRTKGSKK
ncbi:hypothetical protein [Zestomonas carbonaria]|uniref:Uncharacterized protein n=1 Tax=Zestomonas carbonaria TaxID=2762745 RepID=A0A7U7I8G7_9GAMM|nr:hypothetical protein [Pseudomonas carbonaria]CAD5107245.1 hypothetical protein PSEWESI4_01516 [Pseudomonas carbonaria]